MNIIIFEKEHFEGAFPVIKLFDMPGNEITVITSEETHKRFIDLFGREADKFKWVVLTATQKLIFFYSLYRNLKKEKADVLYINTISDNHWLYAFVLSLLRFKKFILTVHDINCLFESRPSWNLRKEIIHKGKKKLLKKIDEFNVVSDTMIPYLQSKVIEKKIHNVPGAVFENRNCLQDISSPIKIIVPGSLDKKRRDYEQVFELASAMEKEKLSLQITLLGGFSDDYGKYIIQKADQLQSEYCKILFYKTSIVDQREFDQQMDAAHFIFIPSVVNTTICGNIPEIYGITKSSGNIFDVIKHAKPFIVSRELTIPANLQTSCFKYENISDIAGFLKKITSSTIDYVEWQKQAFANSKNYTIEKVRERNASLFNS
jgi:hypothetical protein